MTTMTARKTMTESQMAWNLKKGFAWFGTDANGEPADHWHHPIWTREGGYLWDVTEQVYVLEI